MPPEHTDVDADTEAADERDSVAAHRADRPPTPEEEAIADELPLDPEVAEHHREMNEIGANVKGEGRI